MSKLIGPAAHYKQAVASGEIEYDEAQASAAAALDDIRGSLIGKPPRRRFGRSVKCWPAVAGLYLWGGVGRGKTYLMDSFYESLPFSAKRRTHFHRFMLDVHERRRAYAHDVDPIALVAADIARETRVLCFDEFFVSDIADAMILGRLTEVLFEQGVTLIATSNVEPQQLYRDGLQRERFLPAIARIQKHARVMHLDIETDYRLRALNRAEIYHAPCDDQAMRSLEIYFDDIAPERGVRDTVLQVHGRDIPARRLADGIAWFDFHELCETPRAAADYLELARIFQTVTLSHVPVMAAERDDSARRFITLVDTFYDRNVKLIIAAEADIDDLYTGKRLAFEFQRTRSRLTEMRSQEYLAQPHLP